MIVSDHFEIVDFDDRCATPFKFTSMSEAARHLALLGRDDLYVAQVTEWIERRSQHVVPLPEAA